MKKILIIISILSLIGCIKKSNKPSFKIGNSLPESVSPDYGYLRFKIESDTIKKYKIGACVCFLRNINSTNPYENGRYNFVWNENKRYYFDKEGKFIDNLNTTESKKVDKEDYWTENKHIVITEDLNGKEYYEENYEIINGIGILKCDSTWIDDKLYSYTNSEQEKFKNDYKLRFNKSYSTTPVCRTIVKYYDNINNIVIIKRDGIVFEKLKHVKDTKGRIVETESTDNTGNAVVAYKKYNEKNQLIEELVNWNDIKFDFVSFSRFSYDKDGFVISKSSYSINKSEIDKYIITGKAESIKECEINDKKWEWKKQL